MIKEIEFFFNHELSGNIEEVWCQSRSVNELDRHKCDLVASCLCLKPDATAAEIAEVFRVLGFGKSVRSTRICPPNKYGEYRVRLFIDGVYQNDSDYFTDDRNDAENTAAHMCRE